jgi:Protein of unknown function (DUF3828)
MFAMRYVLLIILALIGANAENPAMAQPQPDQEPLRIVREFYAPYLAGRSAPGKDSLDLLRPYASPELARLIDREKACTKRTGGLCALDFDMLVDGQDWKLAGLQVTAQDARPGAMVVRAAFRNFNQPKAVEYSFSIMGGRWMLSDVVIRAGNQRLTTILKTNK